MSVAKRRAPAERILILVRHGQYENNPERLTPLGLKQAGRTARALAGLDVDRVDSSTMLRAVQTAEIIAKGLGKRVHKDELYCERLLPMDRALADRILGPHPTRKLQSEQRRLMANERRRCERAFQRLFAPPTRGKRTDVVVAHGNGSAIGCAALSIFHPTRGRAWTRATAR